MKKDNIANAVEKYTPNAINNQSIQNMLSKVKFDKYSILNKEQFLDCIRLCSRGVCLEIALEAVGAPPETLENMNFIYRYDDLDNPCNNTIHYRLLNAAYKRSLGELLASIYDCATTEPDKRVALQAGKILIDLELKVKEKLDKVRESENTRRIL